MNSGTPRRATSSSRISIPSPLGLQALCSVFRVAHAALLAGLRRHPESFLFPDPVHPLQIHIPALADQVTPHAAVTGTGFPHGNPPDRGSQARVVLFGLGPVALAAARLSKSPAGPALARFQALAHMRHHLAFAGRAYHFPSATSFKMAMSSA
jgi:hypothetical protein